MAYPTASMTGSISRKRVGSVSQRGGNEASLAPLDIQSIQMPSNPQNALALKTASLASTKSLYQTCSTLRKRLRCVEDFHTFLDQPTGAEPLDVVSHMCHTFRLGSPLCHLYNLLIPSFTDPSSPLFANVPAPKQIEYDFPAFASSPDGVKNWAKRPENAKMCQKYIAMFCMAMKQRREEGRWHGEIWALHELWGKSTGDEAEGYDSTGLMKVLQTIETMLDNLPESAITPISPGTPHTAASHRQYGSMSLSASGHGHGHRESYDIPFSMGGLGPGSQAVANLAATMNGGVRISDDAPSAEDMTRTSSSKTSADVNAYKSVEELVSSEKSYVQELEILSRCSQEMLDKQLISAETCHKMFANLSKILEFHRKFLIKLETEYEPIEEGNGPKAWAEGSWGRPFITSEPEFECYGPYCANYLDAITIVNEQMPNLLRGQDLPQGAQPCLHPERELQAFMIKPIQRITKYGLLLDAILHTTAKHEYPYRPELEEGASAVKRIAARINEITDFKAKQATVRELSDRVEDWKGHEIHRFGDLWLDDHFTVTKADQPRDYHVFLFEKMMLCCKEVVPDRKDKKSKNTTILRKDKGMSKGSMPEKRKLALKGRIFVSNINRATLNPADTADPTAAPRLTISWTVPQRLPTGYVEEVADSFVMIGKSEEQMKKWADKVMELATIERRKHEESRMAKSGRYSQTSSDRGHYHQSAFAPPTPATEAPPFSFPPIGTMPNGHSNGNGFNHDDDDATTNGLRSGRSTPSIGAGAHYISTNPNTGRRVQSQQPMAPVDRAELRARAMTEDQNGPSMTQWRSQQPNPPPMPRLASNASSSSEASFMAGPSRGLRMNTSRVDMAEMMEEEEEEEENPPAPQRFSSGRGMTRTPSQNPQASVPYPPPPPLRNRSASTPNVNHLPSKPIQPPPLPHMSNTWVGGGEQAGFVPDRSGSGSSTTLVGGTAYFTKRMSAGNRSSGGSHSTETSDTTSSQQSPATPYGMMAGELRGPTPVSRQNSNDGMVLLRVKAGENAFMVSVEPDANFTTLYNKVLKKIRLGRPVGGSETIQLKWIDSEEDEISLRCDADIEAMFGEAKDSGMGHVNIVVR